MPNKNILTDKKIFLIEDDMFFSNMISAKLANFQCTLINSTNGKEALESLEKEKPDIILLDLLLPGGMDGFAILEKIKSNSILKDIPVIILSNLSQAEDIEKGMELGAFRYLTKALVSPNEIVENIESALNSKKI